MSDTMSETPTQMQRIGSATFYGLASILIVFVNKSVLSINKFPSANVLGIGQMITAVVVLGSLKVLGKIEFPKFDRSIPARVFPLPLLYLLNMITGLMSTKSLSLPMFTVLRRFTILFTMLLEKYILDKSATRTTVLSVLLMMAGAFIAAIGDLTFDLFAYIVVFGNDLCSALYGVYTKKRLDGNDLGKYGLLFYNSLLRLLMRYTSHITTYTSLPILVVITWYTGDFDKTMAFAGWSDPFFVVQFLASCVMGFILMYSIVLCTHYNSPLTTMAIGPLKNTFVTYAGMFIGGDYIFSLVNFVGINVSVLGSLIYTYFAFRAKSQNVISQKP